MKHKSLFSAGLFGATAVALFFSFSDVAYAQTGRQAKNMLYLELGGNGALYSVNYERLLSSSVGLRLGVSRFSSETFTPEDDAKIGVSTVTLMANYLIGSGKSRLELGAGPGVILASGDFDGVGGFEDEGLYGTATIGYRLQPVNGGFLFRLGWTPIYTSDGFSSWFGISFGAAF